jgi:predicted alpha/beta-fold hydrolase
VPSPLVVSCNPSLPARPSPDPGPGAGVPVTSPQLYSAGTTLDLATSLHYLRHHFPTSPLHGMGFSLGASVLARYIGETSSRCLLSSGIVLGCPWDVPGMSIKLESHFLTRKIYSEAMARNLLHMFFGHYDVNPGIFEREESPVKDVLPVLKKYRAKPNGISLKDVDDVMVCKVGGPRREGMFPFENADAYYAWASSEQYIGGVKR